MAAQETIVKVAKGDEGVEIKAPRPTKGGKVKYEIRAEGILVLAYVEPGKARKSLDAIGLRLSGPKAQVKAQPKAASKAADNLV